MSKNMKLERHTREKSDVSRSTKVETCLLPSRNSKEAREAAAERARDVVVGGEVEEWVSGREAGCAGLCEPW